MVYLDTAATAGYRDIDNIIIDTITTAMKQYWQNPSSLYAPNVKEEIDKCRTNIAKFINANPNEIIFTSGASESNSLAIQGWINYQNSPFANVITTFIEHKSILEMVANKNFKCSVSYCNVDEFGFVDNQSLQGLLKGCGNHVKLVSIGFANSEIGTIQDIKTISNLVHEYNGIIHVDATQAFGKIPIDVEELGIDMMSVSGHKVSSVLKGVGFLYKKDNINIQPLIYGAQENGLRGGTENTFSIIGLGKAIDYCDVSQKTIDEMRTKRDYFINLLECKFDCELNGDNYYRLPNNINVTFPQNITGESLLYILDTSDIEVSTGSACNSKSIEPSPVLKAIGLTETDAMKTIRITFADDITYEDINNVINEIDKSIKLIEI